jgi:dihydrofolate synthase/folylpolyglutamate synthase
MEPSIADRIFAHPRFGHGLALHRMLWLKDRLPLGACISPATVIHVTGSNGKGTVTTLTAALLGALGLRVGSFVSPHVSRFEERITIDGAPISAAALARAYAWFEAEEKAYLAAHADEAFGAFEAITAIAFHAFAEMRPDALVLEAGIGGRYDATRAAHGELVALTNIEREHIAVLGPSVEHILYDKADLAPAGGLLVAGRLSPPLRERLTAYGRLQGVDLLYTDDLAEVGSTRFAPGETCATIRMGDIAIEDLRAPTTGSVQLWNAIHALLLARAFLERRGRPIEPARFAEAARMAFATASLPLRFENISENPSMFADGAHTEGATQALAEALRETMPGRPVVLVAGVSAEKPSSILDPLLPHIASVIVTGATHRSAPPEAVAAHIRARHGAPRVTLIESLSQAMARAKSDAQARDGVVLITGAFYLAAEARALIKGEAFAPQQFL